MSTSFAISGKLFTATPPEQKKENFKVRNFVLEITENTSTGQVYNNYIGFQLVNDKCSLLDNLGLGMPVTVHFNIRGSLYEQKAITNLQAWKIEAQQQPQYSQPQQPAYQQPAPQQYAQPVAPPAPPVYQQPQQQTWNPPQQPAPPQQFGQPAPLPPAPPTAPAQPGAPTWGAPQNNDNYKLPF